MQAMAAECLIFAPCSQPFSKPVSSATVRRRSKEGICSCSNGNPNSDSDSGSNPSKEEKKVDWDKAWSSYRLKKKQPFFSMFDMEKYVTRSPQQSNYPLSEEVDPLKRTERATLGFWNDTKFTLAGFGVIVGLVIYMVVIVGVPPSK